MGRLSQDADADAAPRMCALYSSSTRAARSLLNLLPGFQQSVGFKMLMEMQRWKQRFEEVHTPALTPPGASSERIRVWAAKAVEILRCAHTLQSVVGGPADLGIGWKCTTSGPPAL